MPTITARTHADGTKSYRAAIRLKRKGQAVYRESRTFDRKALAKDWVARRELELQEPGVIDKVRHRGVTIGDLIKRYQRSSVLVSGGVRPWIWSVSRHTIWRSWTPWKSEVENFVSHIVVRVKTVKPQTVANDLI